MAAVIITLDNDNNYYVDQFGVPASPGDTIKWKSVNGKFFITIRDVLKFFSARTNPTVAPAFGNLEKITVDSSGTDTSETYTIINTLDSGTEIVYEIYSDVNDQVDAPPKIIIVPST